MFISRYISRTKFQIRRITFYNRFHHYQMSRVMRKPAFCIWENKDPDQLRSNLAADQRIVFATQIVQSLFYLYPKFPASSHLLWLYIFVCVRPGWKPEDRFSHVAAHISDEVLVVLIKMFSFLLKFFIRYKLLLCVKKAM